MYKHADLVRIKIVSKMGYEAGIFSIDKAFKYSSRCCNFDPTIIKLDALEGLIYRAEYVFF